MTILECLRRPPKLTVLLAAVVATIITLLVQFQFILPEVRKFFFPVVTSFTVTERIQLPNKVQISGYMRKVRECEFRGLVFFVGDADNEDTYRERLSHSFRDQPDNASSSRPVGMQSWGPWFVHRPIKEDLIGPDIMLQTHHVCGGESYISIIWVADADEFFTTDLVVP